MIQVKSLSCFLVLLSLSRAWGLMGPTIVSERFQSMRKPLLRRKYVHATVVSPFNTQTSGFVRSGPNDRDMEGGRQSPNEERIDDQRGGYDPLRFLCEQLRAMPNDLLRLKSTADGVRGVYLNRSIREGDVILSLPLDSCLRDDSAPSWMQARDGDGDVDLSSTYNPSDWATRLAAGLLDLQLREEKSRESEIGCGLSLWLSLLPDSECLRASLPVHWPEDTVRNARSTSLELAVDSSYFARAEAVENILFALKSQSALTRDMEYEQLSELCSNALDVVQTRSCRLVDDSSGTSFRVLAPIFDFINHGSIYIRGETRANAEFQLEKGNSLVVRALRNLQMDQEILIDYGDSARPAWRCLLSYGFVPQYNQVPGPGEQATADNDKEDNVAEVYMGGKLYEVGASHVPYEMVAAAFEPNDPVADEEVEIGVSLNPKVALKLAERISDAAFYLLLEPESDLYDDDLVTAQTPFEVISSREAASLRWSQHRILLACALGLREFAADHQTICS